MLSVPRVLKIFLARDPADFRKSFDGLAALVAGVLGADPLSEIYFCFATSGPIG